MLSVILAIVPAALFLFAAVLSTTVLIRCGQRFRHAFGALRHAVANVETVQACRTIRRTVEVRREAALVQPVAVTAATRRRIARPALPLAA
ncbi:MAG: hypothetical protein M0R03_21570 [Novosphingobium sp.]|nr:hypothetical protein [Novosphingobium sp.]